MINWTTSGILILFPINTDKDWPCAELISTHLWWNHFTRSLRSYEHYMWISQTYFYHSRIKLHELNTNKRKDEFSLLVWLHDLYYRKHLSYQKMHTNIPPYKPKIKKKKSTTRINTHIKKKKAKATCVSLQNSKKLKDLGYFVVTDTAFQNAKSVLALRFKRCTQPDIQNQPSS